MPLNATSATAVSAVFTAVSLSLTVTSSLAAAPKCSDLAAAALQDSNVVTATSQIVAASGNTPAYCRVDLEVKPVTNIRVGLPLSEADGGTGGIEGAWNGKIQNLGGGVFVGAVGSVTGPVAAGYVGSNTDTGHNNDWCNEINPDTNLPNSYPCPTALQGGFVLNPSGNTLMKWQVREFITKSLLKQTRWALRLTRMYYRQRAERNYWVGCSTGGRQGLEMAQKYGDLFDGFLVGAPAAPWNRFLFGELWTAVVVNEFLGPAGLPPTKYDAANAAARAACDAKDGVADGILNEPRRCKFNATQLTCEASDDPTTCLTPVEAVVVNRIWDGPRNLRGQRLWGGIPRGTSFSGQVPGGINNLIIDQFVRFWLMEDPSFEWPAEVTMANFAEFFEQASRKFGDGLAESDNPDLDKVRDRGAKIIHYHGTGDVLIMPFGAWKYSSDVMERYGVQESQDFIRTFIYPENGHCGGGPAGTPLINTGDLLKALENWVENGVAPGHIVARSSDESRSRKICMNPNEAVYKGTGSTDDHRSFRCKVNREEPRVLKRDSVTAKLYHEAP